MSAIEEVVTAAATATGELLATATIVFRGGSYYSARQLPYFRAHCAPGVLARLFPNYAS